MLVHHRYFTARESIFKWRHETSFLNKMGLALSLAFITGLLAQVRLYLPFTPVPITGQTFAVLLAGVVLGRWWGGISQALYVLLGVIGLPLFANWGSGPSALIGPTGGYLMGFILAALFVGHISDRYKKSRKFLPMLGVMAIGNFILIYIPGLLVLGIWMYYSTGRFPSILALFFMGAIPFIVGDLIKLLAGAGVAKLVTPKMGFMA